MFLGDDLLPYLVLALGAALVFGNGMALVRPPREAKSDELDRAPVARSAVMIGIGFVAALLAFGLSLLPRPGALRSWRYWAALAGCVAVLAACNMTAVPRQVPAPQPRLSLALLQGNIPQEMKWRADRVAPTLAAYRELVVASRARLIVLPETALPLFLHEVPADYLAGLAAHQLGLAGQRVGIE